MNTQSELAQAAPPDRRQDPIFTDPDLACFAEYLQAYSQTEGWFPIEAAAIWDCLLAFQAERGIAGDLFEIGVYRGKTGAMLAHRARADEHTWLVDNLVQHDPVRAALALVDRADDERVHVETIDSHRLPVHPLREQLFRQCRFIHIDGEHSAAALQTDLATAHDLLTDDGLVAVDDIFLWTIPQLTESLFRYLRQHPDHFQLFLVGYNKAYLTRPKVHHEYMHYCREKLVPRIERIGVDVSLSKTSYPSELNAFGIGPREEGGRPYIGLVDDRDKLLY